MKTLLFSILITSTFTMQTYAQTSLKYLVRPDNKSVESPPLLILLHGVGSNEESMHQVAQFVHPSFVVVSARGPFTSGPNSYRWYHVDFSTGKPVINQSEADESTQILTDFVENLKTELKFNHDKVIIGGFSQGGIMSYELGLNNRDLFCGTVSMSGRMMVSTMEKLQSADLTGSKTLIIHGNADQVLPFQYAEQASSLIQKKGGTVSFHQINIDHSISQETLDILNEWLIKMN